MKFPLILASCKADSIISVILVTVCFLFLQYPQACYEETVDILQLFMFFIISDIENYVIHSLKMQLKKISMLKIMSEISAKNHVTRKQPNVHLSNQQITTLYKYCHQKYVFQIPNTPPHQQAEKNPGYAYKDNSKCINQQPMKRDNSIKRHVWINQSMTRTRQNGQKIINKTENYHIKKSTTPGFYLSLSLTVGSTFQLSSDKLLNDMIGTVTSILLQALGENL